MLLLSGFGTTVLEIKNAVIVVMAFLKRNGLRGKSGDSNYFYTEESIPRTNFCVRIRPFARKQRPSRFRLSLFCSK